MKAVRAILKLCLLVSMGESGYAQVQFTELDVGLPAANGSSVVWGDYDNDGRLDIAMSGPRERSRIYRNNGDGSFTDIVSELVEARGGGLDWGDFDNDGDLDIVIAGGDGFRLISVIYRNDGHDQFTEIDSGLVGVSNGGVAWADYDNDGQLDILLNGSAMGNSITQLFRNLGNGKFMEVGAMLPGVKGSSVAWADFNNDGWPDVLLTGQTEPGTPDIYISHLYRNDDGGAFTLVRTFPGVVSGDVAWGDYNNDGGLDLLFTGLGEPDLNPRYTRVYRNHLGGGVTELPTDLPGVWVSSVAWGDYDNDGRLDFVLTGATDVADENLISRVYRNTGTNGFVDIEAGLPGIEGGSVAWGDYDNDGDLDLLLFGSTTNGNMSRLYRNETTVKNTPPTAPMNLSASVSGQQVTLNWGAATDDQTGAPGLSYNIRIGTRPGGGDIVSPQSAPDGFRRVPQRGNAEHRLFSIVTGLAGGIYYWSVQAVDTAFAGGPFAPEQTFVVPPAIEGIEREPGGTVVLGFLGAAGETYVVEASTDLIGWETLTELTADTGGRFEYIETNVEEIPVRFYRVRSQE